MNETTRIVEATGFSRPVQFTWHADPTRHLLNEESVTLENHSRPETPTSRPKDLANDDGVPSAKAD